MKFLFFVLLAVVAATQAKYLMSPNALSATMDRNEINEQPIVQAAMLTENLFIPMASHMSCNNGGCNAICQALGYNHGRCVSDTTCQCYN